MSVQDVASKQADASKKARQDRNESCTESHKVIGEAGVLCAAWRAAPAVRQRLPRMLSDQMSAIKFVGRNKGGNARREPLDWESGAAFEQLMVFYSNVASYSRRSRGAVLPKTNHS